MSAANKKGVSVDKGNLHILAWIVTGCCRLLLSVVFIFSGFVKAIDPLGTQYKLEEYLAAVNIQGLLPDWATLTASVALSALEFCLGVFLLFAIKRGRVTRAVVAFMMVMVVVALWLALANPVKDCGCFGDAVKLTNWQTFLKNVVLLGAAIVVAMQTRRMRRLISKSNQWIVVNYTILFILATSAWSLYYLPPFDFRPYHVGADIRKGMEIPKGEKSPTFETTFILEKGGKQKEFTLENYPDSTWTFIDAKTVMTQRGYEPPIHDFSITEIETGEDITDKVLDDKGYTFLLIAPILRKANDACFGEIDRLYEYAEENGYRFYCLTASNEADILHWKDVTGAEYPFCFTDGTTLKTIVRSNPGLLLLKDGVVIGKWSHHNLPAIETAQARMPLEKQPLGQMPTEFASDKVMKIVLWYVLPLLLLTLADRFWAWTRWFRNHRKKSRRKGRQEEKKENGDSESREGEIQNQGKDIL